MKERLPPSQEDIRRAWELREVGIIPKLRAKYDPLLESGLPDHLQRLLDRLDEAEPGPPQEKH